VAVAVAVAEVRLLTTSLKTHIYLILVCYRADLLIAVRRPRPQAKTLAVYS